MNKLIQYSVLVAVGVLIFSTLLIPLVNDATAKTATVSNDGLFYVTDSDGPLHYVYENKTLTVNDSVIEKNYSEGTTVLFCDAFIIRGYDNDMRMRGLYDYNCSSFDITVDNGTISGVAVTTTEHTVNVSYTYFYGITPNEENLIMKGGDPVYINADTVVEMETLFHPTGISNDQYVIAHAVGSMAGELDVTLYDIHRGTVINDITVQSYTWNVTPVSGFSDLYSLSTLDIVLQKTDGENVLTHTISNYTMVVPSEITGTKTVYANGSTGAMIGVIPVIVIVGLIAGIVGIVAVRRGN